MRVHAHAAHAADLEEREDEVVVAGVEVETELDDGARLPEIGIRLLHRTHRRQLGEQRDRLGLEVQHDPRRDVVDDDRPVGDGGDLLEVAHDPADRRLAVVRRHDEEAVDAELVRTRRQVHRVRRRVRPGAGDHRRTVADLVDGCLVESEALVVGERRRLTRRPRDDEAVRSVVHEVRGQRAERLEIDRTVPFEGCDDRGKDLTQHVVILRHGRQAHAQGVP